MQPQYVNVLVGLTVLRTPRGCTLCVCLYKEDFEGSWHTDPRQGTPAQGGSTTAVQYEFRLLVAGSVACGQGDSTGFGAVYVCCGF